MKCPVCAADNGAAANFCSHCGSPQNLRVCPHCETINDRSAASCAKCGYPLTSASGSAAAMRESERGDASETSSSHDMPAVESDTQSIKELLASLEKEVERQLAEDARLPAPASAATPAETRPPSADQAYRRSHCAAEHRWLNSRRRT
jgi:predicted amidophosphoribosyltransferase